MGATTFATEAVGATMDEAFGKAVKRAQYDFGHAGYTGTIAEKSSCILIHDTAAQVAKKYVAAGGSRASTLLDLQEGKREAIAYALIDIADPRIDDKWGPAGCLDLGPVSKDSKKHRFLFFGWASE